jgi:hypothetical protein
MKSATYQRASPREETAATRPPAHPYRNSTKRDNIRFLKRFYLWLQEKDTPVLRRKISGASSHRRKT